MINPDWGSRCVVVSLTLNQVHRLVEHDRDSQNFGINKRHTARASTFEAEIQGIHEGYINVVSYGIPI